MISTGRSPIIHYSLEFYYKTCYDTEDYGLPCGDGWPDDTGEWGIPKNPGSWIVLNQESGGLITSYTHIWTNGTVNNPDPYMKPHFFPGTLLNYRIRAKSLVGWGPYSEIT